MDTPQQLPDDKLLLKAIWHLNTIRDQSSILTPRNAKFLKDKIQDALQHQARNKTLYLSIKQDKSLYLWMNRVRDERKTIIEREINGEPQDIRSLRRLATIRLLLPNFAWDKQIARQSRQEPANNFRIHANEYAPAFEARWDIRFEQLKEYKELNGHTDVNTKNSKLGDWCRCQRVRYRNQLLCKSHLDKLNRIGFNFTPGIPGKRVPEILPPGSDEDCP